MMSNKSRDYLANLRLSIIIATINRHPHVDQCLWSIDQALKKCKHVNCEVIIVDQSIHLYEAARSYAFPVTVIAAAPGASHARNIGLRRSSGDYVWFLDDDAVVVRFEKFSSAEIDEQSILFTRWLDRPSSSIAHLNGSLVSRLWLIRTSATFCYQLPRQLAQQVGGFDEHFGPGQSIAAGEDLDLLIRARLQAKKKQPVTFIATVSHPHSSLPRKKRVAYAQARGYVLAKNHWHVAMAIECIYSLLAAIRGDHSRIAALLQGYTKRLTESPKN